MHRHGTEADATRKAFDHFGENLKGILKDAEPHYEKVNVYVFSDHGMCDVKHACDTRTAFEKSSPIAMERITLQSGTLRWPASGFILNQHANRLENGLNNALKATGSVTSSCYLGVVYFLIENTESVSSCSSRSPFRPVLPQSRFCHRHAWLHSST